MQNEFLKTNNKSLCNGCGICTMVCKFDAIKMVEDSEGFFYPQIDESMCRNCGVCKRICSNFNDSETKSDIYLARIKNNEVLLNSSSGGMFYALAKYVINKGGEVFGVEYDENLKVQHNHYNNLKGCIKFSGSKYVRSNLKNSFEEVKKILDDNRMVLFTGTSCQCNALKTYLKKDYSNLILCDILCHANPSQKIFNLYLSELERKNNKKIINVVFRAKINGWNNQTPIIIFEDGTELYDDTFFKAFVSELINRPSCSSCKFASSYRVTDFTIGDFWGLKQIYSTFIDDNKGQSLLLVNTDRGRKVFKEISNDIEYKKSSNDLPLQYNHFNNVPPHKNREKFFNNFREKYVIEDMKRYLRFSIPKRIFNDVKKIYSKINK